MRKQTFRPKGKRGQILIMATLMIVPLFGVLGLVTDIGYMHYVKMTAQSAAEAGAKAAIINFLQTQGGGSVTCPNTNPNIVCASTPAPCSTSITTPANSIQNGCLYAQAHGFNSAGAVTYQTGASTTPPTAPGIGTPSYWVTFRAARQVPMLFSAILGNFNGTVVARSTAAIIGSPDCIYALKPTGTAISVGGTNSALTSSCGVFDNSSDNCDISTSGGGTVRAPSYNLVGNVTGCSQAPNLTGSSPVTGVPPGTDPLSYLPAPVTCTSSAPCQCDFRNINLPNQSVVDLYPGTYCGGINVGNQTVNFHNNADGSPGIYNLVGGGLTTQSANSIINGTDVMFFNTYGDVYSHGSHFTETYSPISINANSTVDLSAPTAGTYAGILFYDDRTAPEASDSYGGGSTAIYQGTIYTPTADITMYGNSTASTNPSQNSQYTLIIAYTISLQGTTGLSNNYSTLPNNASPIQQVGVVE